MRPLLDGHADAVFGSRYLTAEQRRVLPFWHSMINKALTLVSNMFSNLNVTDMETCYKVFRTDLLKSIPIRSNRFGFEPEITMKCAKRKLRIYEVPISYHGRTYEEGKKIGWKDGVKVFGVILHFWLIDDLYTELSGRGLTNSQYGTPRYLAWITRRHQAAPAGHGARDRRGNGNLTGRLMGKRMRYVAAEQRSGLPPRPAQPVSAHPECRGPRNSTRTAAKVGTIFRSAWTVHCASMCSSTAKIPPGSSAGCAAP